MIFDTITQMVPLWEAIRLIVSELVQEEKTHFLTALLEVESSFRSSSLSKLVKENLRATLSEKIKILNYSPNLERHFESLNREWLEECFSIEPIDLKYFANPKSMIFKKGWEHFFAEVHGKVVGTCALLRDGARWELAKMAVTESARGKGIGKKLVTEAIQRAKLAKARKLLLITNSKLVPATKLYEKFGFKETFRGQHPKYKRGDVVMEKLLV